MKESTLTDSSDWEAWILIVKILAGDSWQYIDPSTTTTLAQPQKPQPSDFGGTNSSNIDPNQRVHWIEFNTLYYRELKEYERAKAKIQKAEEYIITHIDTSFLLQKANYSSLRDFLASLEKALAPTQSSREQTIIDRYTRAKTFDARNTSFETWQQEYLVAYLRAKEANIPDVSGDRAHWDLVKAISQLDSGYAAVISTQITSAQQQPAQQLAQQSAQQSGQILPSVEHTLSAFAQHYRRTYTRRSPVHGGTFAATLNQQESPYQRKRLRDDGTPVKPCLCGDLHLWRDCPYIDTSLRREGFVEDPEKAKKITEFEASDIKGILGQIRDKKQRYKRFKTLASTSTSKDTDDTSTPDSIVIDAGDDPALYSQ
jgi:hypothetical protein